MTTTPTIAELERRIAELEAEVAHLRPLAAAAQEAHAFFAGRRPGFAPSYPSDVLRDACAPGTERRTARSPAKPRPRRA